jgi:hypothetical protein
MTCPSGKIPYVTAREAWAFMRYRNSASARFTHKHRGQVGQVYRCPQCAYFHTTRGVNNFRAVKHDTEDNPIDDEVLDDGRRPNPPGHYRR